MTDPGDDARDNPESGSAPRIPESDEELLSECRWQVFTGSGPGGQHRNRKATAVRLVHLPTGITVVAQDERSQATNRSRALERLRERLERRLEPRAPRIPTRVPRRERERRLRDKRRRSERRRQRRTPDPED